MGADEEKGKKNEVHQVADVKIADLHSSALLHDLPNRLGNSNRDKFVTTA